MSKLTDEQRQMKWREGNIRYTESKILEVTKPLLQRIAELEETNAQLREQNTEVDKTCAELERKSDQDDETIIWQAKEISEKIDKLAERDARIAELEQRNSDLHEDVQRFKQHALNEKAARLELERQLEEARKDAERYRFIRSGNVYIEPNTADIYMATEYVGKYYKDARDMDMDIDEAIDAAMQKGQS